MSECDVIEASEEDIQRAVQAALRRAECSAEQLLAQGRAGRFDSVRARLAWVAVGDVLPGDSHA